MAVTIRLVVHDTHHCGLFPQTDWLDTLTRVGFEPDRITLESDEFEVGYYQIFVGRKP